MKKLKRRQTSLKPIPHFKNEDEEAEFWANHELSDVFDVSKRVSESLLSALKAIANKKDVPYQSLVKMFLDEKVKEEYRATR